MIETHRLTRAQFERDCRCIPQSHTIGQFLAVVGERLHAMIRQDRQMQSIQQIPGVGDLAASALVAAVGDFSIFKSGRQFASWVGLTPRQVGTEYPADCGSQGSACQVREVELDRAAS